MSSLSGILPVDKPAGPTSHDVVSIARRSLGERRIGHTGTLDPFASGLLLLCIGPATRLAEYLSALPKSYAATLELGVTTDTDDRLGSVIATRDWVAVDLPSVQSAFSDLVGNILQVPPQYSAKKVAGERMYDVARRGDAVELAPAPVTITSIQIIRFEPPTVEFTVDCSTGTYIRAIARDVGAALGVGAHLSALRRTRIGGWGVEDALTLDQLTDPERVSDALAAPADALSHLPRQTVEETESRAIRHGNAVPARIPQCESPVVLVGPDGALLALAEHRGETIQPRKVFA
jgi:tRNA pseudouridine55 synthase